LTPPDIVFAMTTDAISPGSIRMHMENNKKAWMLLVCLAAGISGGCSSGGGGDDDPAPIAPIIEPPIPEPPIPEPEVDPTGNMTGSWLAQSTNYNHVDTSTDPADSYSYVGTGNRQEVFIINDSDGLVVYTCGRGVFGSDAVTNIENTLTALSFDYANAHYVLEKVDTDSLEGSFTAAIVHSATETTTEDGAVTFHKFKTLAEDDNAFIGALHFQLNASPLDSVNLACFMQNQVQSQDAIRGSATEKEIAIAGIDDSGNFEGVYADSSYNDSAPDDGAREFVFYLNEVAVTADRDGDSTLDVDISATLADDIFSFNISAAGVGADFNDDAFNFEFTGEGELNLSGDASSDAP